MSESLPRIHHQVSGGLADDEQNNQNLTDVEQISEELMDIKQIAEDIWNEHIDAKVLTISPDDACISLLKVITYLEDHSDIIGEKIVDLWWVLKRIYHVKQSGSVRSGDVSLCLKQECEEPIDAFSEGMADDHGTYGDDSMGNIIDEDSLIDGRVHRPQDVSSNSSNLIVAIEQGLLENTVKYGAGGFDTGETLNQDDDAIDDDILHGDDDVSNSDIVDPGLADSSQEFDPNVAQDEIISEPCEYQDIKPLKTVHKRQARGRKAKRKKPNELKTQEAGLSYNCTKCAEHFSTKNKLNLHMKNHREELKCSCCDRVFKYEQSLRMHEKQHIKKTFDCEVCEKHFTWASELKNHERIHNVERPHYCTLCKQTFKQAYHLKAHLKTHTGEKSHACQICGKCFTRENDCKRHQRIHTVREKSWECEDCGRHYMDKAALTHHKKSHMDDRPFSCEDCGKTFITNSGLRSHLLSHTGQKSFICQMCGRGFARSSELINHERIHTGEKPYCCKICGKRFSEAGNLRTHSRVHSKAKPYTCPVCTEAFTYNVTMKAHMKRVHGLTTT